MNVTALRSVTNASRSWQDALMQLQAEMPIHRVASWQGKLFRIADTFVTMPYIFAAACGDEVRIPLDIAVAFKFFRGIAFAAQHQLVFGGDDREPLHQYAERHRLLARQREACPASPTLIDKAEREIEACLRSQPEAGKSLGCDISISRIRSTLFVHARLVQFYASMALLALDRNRQATNESDPLSRGPLLPVPLVRTAMNSADFAARSKLVIGLKRLLATFDCDQGTPTTLQSALQQAMSNGPVDRVGLLRFSYSLNQELLGELHTDAVPSLDDFYQAQSSVFGEQWIA